MDAKLKTFAKKMYALKLEKKQIEARLKEINKSLEETNPKFVEYMESQGLENFKMTYGTFYIHCDVYPRIVDEVKCFASLRKGGLGDVIKETIHWQTLKGLVKELRAENKPAPEGVDVFDKTDVRLRMTNSKEEM